jgi:ADP-ribose pyrophosphatase YjhB (NUDIX family)
MSDKIVDGVVAESWKTYNVAQGVLRHNGQVLLVGNDYGSPELAWSLPGGRTEPGENLLTTLVREFAEETGLVVAAGDLLYVMEARSPAMKRHFITSVFEVSFVNPPDSDAAPQVSFGTDVAVKAVRWVTPEEAAALLQRPSLGEGLLDFLYYGLANMPRRYYDFPNYTSTVWQPLSYPPRKDEG